MQNKDIQIAQSEAKRGRKRLVTGILIAAVVAILAASAFAADVFGLKSLLIESTGKEITVFPSSTDEELKVKAEKLSLAGFEGSPEYRAYEEWVNWLDEYSEASMDNTPDNDWIPENGELKSIYNFYPIYNDATLDKLLEIAEKYSLKLHTKQEVLTENEFFGVVDASVLSLYPGYIYEDGSFLSEALYNECCVQILRNMEGTIPTMSLDVWDREKCSIFTYTTKQNCHVDIIINAMLGRTQIFYSENGAFILVNAFIGDETSATTIADAIDFGLLCSDKITHGINSTETLNSYKEVIEKYRIAISEEYSSDDMIKAGLNYLVPDCLSQGGKIGYIISDINGDGAEELMIAAQSDAKFYHGLIFEIFTQDKNGTPELLYESGERTSVYYAGENLIYRSHSESPSHSSFCLCSVEKDPAIKASLEFDIEKYPEKPWRVLNGIWEHISDKEADKLLADMEYLITEPHLVMF